MITEIFQAGSAFIWGFFFGLILLGLFRFYEWNHAGRPKKLRFTSWDITYLLIYFTGVQAMILVMFLYLHPLIPTIWLIISLSVFMAFTVAIAILGRVTRQAVRV